MHIVSFSKKEILQRSRIRNKWMYSHMNESKENVLKHMENDCTDEYEQRKQKK